MVTYYDFIAVPPGGEWLPTSIGGNVIWLRSDLAWQDAAKTVPCTNESLIWTGEDKSGNLRDSVQPTEAQRPVYLTNQLNGYPAWKFLIDDFFLGLNFTLVQPITVFAVFLKDDNFNYNTIFDGYTQNGCRALIYPPANCLNMYAGSFIGGEEGFPISLNTYYLGVFTFNTTDSSLRLNGSTLISGANLGNTNPNGMTIGSNLYSSPSQSWSGNLVELFAYDSVILGENLTNAENYLNTRYAIY